MPGVAIAAALLLAGAPPERVAVGPHRTICVVEDAVSRTDGLGAAVAHALEGLMAEMRLGEHVRPTADPAACDTARGDVVVRLSVFVDRPGRTAVIGLTATDGRSTWRDAVTKAAQTSHTPEAKALAERLFQRLVFEPHE